MIPSQAVEAAANHLYPGWETSPADWKDYFRRKATEALEAAAPHMLAAAWEEGYMFSYDQERGGNGALPIPVPEHLAEDLAHWNPHRTPDAV